jgi:integrase
MVLTMSRPWKHPKTGVYYFRKVVPERLRALVGKREEKQSLNTRDAAEAKRLHTQVSARVDEQWANLENGPVVLTEIEAHRLAAPVFDRWVEWHRDNPSTQTFWDVELGPTLFDEPKGSTDHFDLETMTFVFDVDPNFVRIYQMQQRCYSAADEGLAAHGLIVDEASRKRLAVAISKAFQRASVLIARLANGEEVVPLLGSNVRAPLSPGPALKQSTVLLDALFAGWKAEQKPADKTSYEWGRVLEEFKRHLGHGDASRLAADDVLRWKDALVAADHKPKTIQDAKIAPIRAILQWGVRNQLLQQNPAHGIAVGSRKKKAGEKIRSFTEEEAATILRESRKHKNEVIRWVPWLAAYSGARISELCQLRKEDIFQEDGIWCMKFDPDAGSLKNASSERRVPLHRAVIESGFLEFVDKSKKGPLFAKLSPDMFGNRGGNGTKMIGRFVRSLGIADLRISPAHSWRHRMKTIGRRYGLAPDIMDSITGHSPRTVGDSYGEFPVGAMLSELEKVPVLALD